MTGIDERALKRALAAPPDDAAEAVGGLAARAEREGLIDVAYATLDTPIGTMTLAATPRGLVRVVLPGRRLDAVLEELAGDLSPRVLELPARLDDPRRELEEYFAGRRRAFDLDLDWALTRPGFYREVLRAASRELPFGVTASYGEVAAWAGRPRAFRAAGTALGHNPIPIVVPCHRVLRAGGEVGSYGGGTKMKRFLLRLEGALDDS
jgi:methylated-DNA-[protein]-cysteine S-methyltransferase